MSWVIVCSFPKMLHTTVITDGLEHFMPILHLTWSWLGTTTNERWFLSCFCKNLRYEQYCTYSWHVSNRYSGDCTGGVALPPSWPSILCTKFSPYGTWKSLASVSALISGLLLLETFNFSVKYTGCSQLHLMIWKKLGGVFTYPPDYPDLPSAQISNCWFAHKCFNYS